MRRRWESVRLSCGAAALIVLVPTVLQAAPSCDEYDPFGPVRSAQIRLGPGDLVDENGDELRSFIATDSIGKVDVEIVSSSPRDLVRRVSAVPEISMLSPYHSERLKGIHVAVSLTSTKRPVSVVLKLRQVCAKHFRNTFLYY